MSVKITRDQTSKAYRKCSEKLGKVQPIDSAEQQPCQVSSMSVTGWAERCPEWSTVACDKCMLHVSIPGEPGTPSWIKSCDARRAASAAALTGVSELQTSSSKSVLLCIAAGLRSGKFCCTAGLKPLSSGMLEDEGPC